MAEIEKQAQHPTAPPAYSSPAVTPATPLTLASPQSQQPQVQPQPTGQYVYPAQPQQVQMQPQPQYQQVPMQQVPQAQPMLVQNPDGTYAYAQYPVNPQYVQQQQQQQPQGPMVELPGGPVQQAMELPGGPVPQQQPQMQQMPQQPQMVYQQQPQPQMVQSQATLVNQPLQQPGTFVMQPHTGTVMFQPTIPLANLGPSSSLVQCPACHTTSRTTLVFLPGDCTHLWALGFCFFTCLGCIPYFIDTFHDVQHKCGNCGTLLATFKRSGGTDVHAH